MCRVCTAVHVYLGTSELTMVLLCERIKAHVSVQCCSAWKSIFPLYLCTGRLRAPQKS